MIKSKRKSQIEEERSPGELGGPSSGLAHGGARWQSVSLKLTIRECNNTSLFETLYCTECLSCLAPKQWTGPACICNTGKIERNALQKVWVIKLWTRFYKPRTTAGFEPKTSWSQGMSSKTVQTHCPSVELFPLRTNRSLGDGLAQR